MTSIFLAGGTGFVGRSLLRYFLSNPDCNCLTITVLSRNPDIFISNHPEFSLDSRLRFLKGDILDVASLPNESFDFCIHAAAETSQTHRTNLMGWFDEIVCGTRNILDWARANLIQRTLFLSSGAVYGDQRNVCHGVLESQNTIPDPLKATSLYGIAKRAAEHLCILYYQQFQLPVVIARLFTFVGPDLARNSHYAIGNLIGDALDAEAIAVSGDGTPLRTYLEQSDLAHWLWILLKEGMAGEAYNVGSNEVVSIAQLAYLIRDLLAPNKTVYLLGKPQLSGGGQVYVPDITKALDLHGLRVTIPLAEAIQKTALAYRHY